MGQQEVDNSLHSVFQGYDVKVFLINGSVMVGKADFRGKYLSVKDPRTGNEAVVNLDHVISVSRR